MLYKRQSMVRLTSSKDNSCLERQPPTTTPGWWDTHIICKTIFGIKIIFRRQIKMLIITFITQTEFYKNLLGYWGYIEKSDSKPG